VSAIILMYNYLMNKDINPSRDFQSALGMRIKEAVRVNQSATDMFDEAFTQFLGVNRTDGRCLDVIARFGKVTAGQLAQESGLTTGAVTVLLDRLEAAGYVRRSRDTADRRKVWIELTEATDQITDRVFGHFVKLGPALMGRFSPEQVAGIIQFLEMGSLINRQMAEVLTQHIDRHAADAQARVIQARAFERAADAGMATMQAALRALPPVELD